MRIAYLDCFSGISGDMFLGALLDAGVPLDLFEKTVAGLNIGATLEPSRVVRAGITASKLDVVVHGEKDLPREEFWEHQHAVAGHRHLDTEEHTHADAEGFSEHPDDRVDDGGQNRQRERSLTEILQIIAEASITESARRTANEIFLALGAAEAKIHDVDVSHVHFHEVGAADAIVDIVCAAVGAEALGVDLFVSSPLNVGSGTVACSHGILPIPAPATLELLREAPIYSGEIEKELVTPTGAAIVKVLVSSFGPRPAMTTERIGYGAGTRDFPRHPNVLRLSVGELQEVQPASELPASFASREEEIAILEANLDDLNPQVIGYVMDTALADGALDVFTAAVQMKKSRPGTVLSILARPEDEERMRELLFRESSTLGVRSRREKRFVLARRHETVTTPWGNVRIKIAGPDGAISQYAPEYEDCRRIASEHHVPLKTVMQEAIRLYLDQKHG